MEPVGEETQVVFTEPTEDDIQTLKEALNVKIRRLAEIKKKLGLTDISTISYDVKEGLTRIGESAT
ncbi:unnamed protein product [Mesocestoides corti]|uniref:Phage protein n=1 Tax=Mesocestoides corti TaxID=53468 RepID=A0A0R3UMS6_MESCO|nr:unnamed protein product [Mesocestoides corti]